MLVISTSLFFVWFCPESQSVMYRCGPGFYVMHTLYCWILKRMHCSHWDSVVVPFLIIVTNDLGLHWLLWQNSSGNISLGHLGCLVFLFLCNWNGCWCCIGSCFWIWAVHLPITCSRTVSRPTPYASVSKYRGPFLLLNFVHTFWWGSLLYCTTLMCFLPGQFWFHWWQCS